MLFVDEDQILAKVTDKAFKRGRKYYDSAMVESAVRRGNRLFAEVLGSEEDPYNVGVLFQESDFSASCTCPYEWEGYCKHIVAVLLTWVHDRGLVAERAPIEDMLSALDADELRALIFRMVKYDPGLSEIIDEYCHRAMPTS